MASFNDIGLSQPASSTITMKIATVTIDRNSTITHQEILSLGDPDSSAAVAAVTNAAPNSTRYGVNVRVIGGPSTATDFAVRALLPSTASDNPVTVSQGSTAFAVQVSTVAGAVVVRSSAAAHLATVYQSTASDLVATIHGNQSSNSSEYLPVRLTNGTAFLSASQDYQQDSTMTTTSVFGPTLMLRTGAEAPASTDSWEMVRGTTSGHLFVAVTPDPGRTLESTTALVTSTHSTAIYPIISSAAGLRHKVYAYFVSSTHTNPSTIIFCSSASGSGFDHWHVGLGSGSSGITGANMAVPPPGFIFAGVAQNALNVKVEGGSSVTATAVVRVSVSYFTEA
jgi:hypothetical protein